MNAPESGADIRAVEFASQTEKDWTQILHESASGQPVSRVPCDE